MVWQFTMLREETKPVIQTADKNADIFVVRHSEKYDDI